jgi:hypothetical protein
MSVPALPKLQPLPPVDVYTPVLLKRKLPPPAGVSMPVLPKRQPPPPGAKVIKLFTAVSYDFS